MKLYLICFYLIFLISAILSQSSGNKTDPTPTPSSDKDDSGSGNSTKTDDSSSKKDASKTDDSSSKKDASKTDDSSSEKDASKTDNSSSSPKSTPSTTSKAELKLTRPIHLEAQRMSMIEIGKPVVFEWTMTGKPRKQPDAFQLTLALRKPTGDVTLVIADDISPTTNFYVWNFNDYKPADENAITIDPKLQYNVYLHDKEVAYNKTLVIERFKPASKQVRFYKPKDISGDYSFAHSNTLSFSALGITSLLLCFTI